MKLLILLFASSIIFSGCYTLLWTPDQDFPSGYLDEGYYSDPYYGGYEYYYEYPWWISMSPPTRSSIDMENKSVDRNNEIRELRNRDTGRTNPDIRLRPPTRSSDNDSASNNSGTVTKTETKRSDNSNSSENRDNTRNTGGRNSGGNRR